MKSHEVLANTARHYFGLGPQSDRFGIAKKILYGNVPFEIGDSVIYPVLLDVLVEHDR